MPNRKACLDKGFDKAFTFFLETDCMIYLQLSLERACQTGLADCVKNIDT